MNGRARRPAAARCSTATPKSDSRVMEKDPRKAATPVKGSANAGTRGTMNRIQSRRERKLALQQDVDKLKKKLRHEENVHRALERAFTRPLGALPRLPPYLPSQTLALLAEVAVLEEEVVRLEEQVVNFRQGIYQEAIIFSSAKNAQLPSGEVPVPAQLMPPNPVLNSEVPATTVSQGSDHPPNARPSLHNGVANGKQTPRKPVNATSPPSQDDRSGAGKENQSFSNTSSTSSRQTPPLQQKTTNKSRATPPDRRSRATPAHQTNTTAAPDRKRPAADAAAAGSNSDKVTSSHDDSSSSVPNKLSEELLRCLLTIFSRMGSAGGGGGQGQGDEDQQAPSPSVSGSSSESSGSEDAYPQDPYGILELGARDIGPYKRFHVVDAASFDPNALAGDGDGDGDAPLVRRLKALLRRLSSVDLAVAGLSHQQKLAFWINIYNSCMMNAFLEQGIPTTPQMLVAMMPKATISVGGRTHSAMSIEHFILRLPYSAKQVNREEGAKGDDDDDVTAARGAFGLEWPEPLVTFALSCGSWSSPAVRVYTAARVEEQLEAAKREYLQAAVGVSMPGKLAVPKLLHWYLLDFAKDVDALMDWVCLQLPPELRHKAMRVVEDGRRAGAEPGRIQVLPYEFRFRYLLAS
ncbi:unnamed protein product [Miscanthus lutarioriparius]|uniref:Ternary complex factor MIP1 leucine-zipper domain-containing protein n=1 Tax=Miscanthus lutarioriparius TaxID=422564 RepID=A0A811NLV2_9POAL|nr:unnamed protein product [Miscanthus lutarioriparius]